MSAEEVQSHWREFHLELVRRMKQPAKHPTFVMYFVLIVLLAGGFGIWDLLLIKILWMGRSADFTGGEAVMSAVQTYFVAIAATATVDLILASREKRYILMFYCGSALIIGLLAILGSISQRFWAVVLLGIIGTVASLVLWWLANADNANLLDKTPPPAASTGGDPKTPLTGTLEGIEH